MHVKSEHRRQTFVFSSQTFHCFFWVSCPILQPTQLHTSLHAIMVSCSPLPSLSPFVCFFFFFLSSSHALTSLSSTCSHILQPVQTFRCWSRNIIQALVWPTAKKHSTAPFFCPGNGAARQILYFSGNSDGGKPAHWHRFSWSTILLQHTHRSWVWLRFQELHAWNLPEKREPRQKGWRVLGDGGDKWKKWWKKQMLDVHLHKPKPWWIELLFTV